MTALTLRGNRIGEALQFDGNGNTVAVEIGLVSFAATDPVTITFAHASLDPITGQLIGTDGDDVLAGTTGADDLASPSWSLRRPSSGSCRA